VVASSHQLIPLMLSLAIRVCEETDRIFTQDEVCSGGSIIGSDLLVAVAVCTVASLITPLKPFVAVACLERGYQHPNSMIYLTFRGDVACGCYPPSSGLQTADKSLALRHACFEASA